MANNKRNESPAAGQNDSAQTEHDRVRSSNDRDQELEREGIESERNRGYDETAHGKRSQEDVDPDSADADVNRDDTVEDV